MAIIGRTLSFCYVTTEIAPKNRNAHTHDYSQQANTQIWYVEMGSLTFYDAKWMQKTERNTNKNKRESKIKTVCSKTNRKRKKKNRFKCQFTGNGDDSFRSYDLLICVHFSWYKVVKLAFLLSQLFEDQFAKNKATVYEMQCAQFRRSNPQTRP